MPSTLVTVVIPIFNQAEFVVETVGSAVRQTCRDLQIVVVDDGSTDGSADRLAAESVSYTHLTLPTSDLV